MHNPFEPIDYVQMVESSVLIQYKQGYYTIIAISPDVKVDLKVGDRVSVNSDYHKRPAQIKVHGEIYFIVPYDMLKKIKYKMIDYDVFGWVKHHRMSK